MHLMKPKHTNEDKKSRTLTTIVDYVHYQRLSKWLFHSDRSVLGCPSLDFFDGGWQLPVTSFRQ